MTSSTISLLLAREIDEIVNGVDEAYKSGPGAPGETPMKPKPIKPAPAVPAMASSSHLDAVPQATPINRSRNSPFDHKTFILEKMLVFFLIIGNKENLTKS